MLRKCVATRLTGVGIKYTSIWIYTALKYFFFWSICIFNFNVFQILLKFLLLVAQHERKIQDYSELQGK